MSLNERQDAINALYAAYSDAGDDDMHARLRVKDDGDELRSEITDEELDLAQAHYADINDLLEQTSEPDCDCGFPHGTEEPHD